MKVEGQITIDSSIEQIWVVVSDIENAARVFKDIKEIEILEKPQSGLFGTKWKETREFMGKDATETMWITDVVEKKSFVSEAKNSGCVYHSSIFLTESDGRTKVTKTFESTPETFVAKLMTPMMLLMRGTLKKCLLIDLKDLKAYVENQS